MEKKCKSKRSSKKRELMDSKKQMIATFQRKRK